jgi:hypothetical protein
MTMKRMIWAVICLLVGLIGLLTYRPTTALAGQCCDDRVSLDNQEGIPSDSEVSDIVEEEPPPPNWFDEFIEAAILFAPTITFAVGTVWKPVIKSLLLPLLSSSQTPASNGRLKLYNDFLIILGVVVLSAYYVFVQDNNLLQTADNPYIQDLGIQGQQIVSFVAIAIIAMCYAEVWAGLRTLPPILRRIAKAV